MISSRPPSKYRYTVARDTPASAAMSSSVVLATPNRVKHVSAASISRSRASATELGASLRQDSLSIRAMAARWALKK